MNSFDDIAEFVKNGYKHYLAHVTIDMVIFGYHEQQLKILLLKWGGYDDWGLPGGFIKLTEPISQAAHRILQERTGLDDVFLQQFYTFGDSAYRTQGPNFQEIAKRHGRDTNHGGWLQERTLAISYFALVEYSKVEVTTDIFTYDYQWCDVNEVPLLLFDHSEQVKKALTTLRTQIYHQPIGYNLLPDKFTIPEIHSLYETILDKKLDIRNFSKKLMNVGIIKKLDEQRAIGPHRSPFLYQFDEEVYESAFRQGIVHTY